MIKIKFNTTNSKKSFSDQFLIAKLAVLKKEQKLQALWGWIKSNQITYVQYHLVMDYILKLEAEPGQIKESATIEVIEPTKS